MRNGEWRTENALLHQMCISFAYHSLPICRGNLSKPTPAVPGLPHAPSCMSVLLLHIFSNLISRLRFARVNLIICFLEISSLLFSSLGRVFVSILGCSL